MTVSPPILHRPQPWMPNLSAALTSQVSQQPHLGCSPSSSCHRTAIFQKTKAYFMEKQHSKTKISVSNKYPSVPVRKQHRIRFTLNITDMLHCSGVFSRVVSNLERSKERAPLFLQRENQIQRFCRHLGYCAAIVAAEQKLSLKTWLQRQYYYRNEGLPICSLAAKFWQT